MSDFLKTFRKQFFYYKTLADKSIEQLDDEHFFHQFDETNNSVALLVSHLSGNMLSRWTNFQFEDGEKKWRKRDSEFEIRNRTRADLMKLWQKAWVIVDVELEPLSEKKLSEIIYIRNEGHTILQALFRQSNHLSYHVGQIVHQAKLLKTNDFKCLSIPKGESEAYFQKKMAEGKGNRHFTDRIFDEKNKKA